MMLLTVRVVHVTRSQALQVNEVAPLIGSSDSLDLNAASDLDLLVLRVEDLKGAEGEVLVAKLHHKLVEFF